MPSPNHSASAFLTKQPDTHRPRMDVDQHQRQLHYHHRGSYTHSHARTRPEQTGVRRTNASETVAGETLRLHTTTRETFLEDLTPVDRARGRDITADEEHEEVGEHDGVSDEEASRISHDLSIPPRQGTRDSLVDNMLLSLDQYAPPQTSHTADEDRLYGAFNEEDDVVYTEEPVRELPRSQKHAYTYSSDYDSPDVTDRASSHYSQGRRSNSSTNFATSLQRINSVRVVAEETAAANPYRTVPSPGRQLHSRSRKGSKSSSTNSLEMGYAQVSGTQRWNRNMRGRSSSVDCGAEQSQGTPAPMTDLQYRRQQVAALTPIDYEAAPTPNVPGGPRRFPDQIPLTPSTTDSMPADRPAASLGRNENGAPPNKMFQTRERTSDDLGQRYALNETESAQPFIPTLFANAAPAPLIGYNKLKDLEPLPLPPRQGFFRRMFGGSRADTPPALEDRQRQESSSSLEQPDRSTVQTPQPQTLLKNQPPSKESTPNKDSPHLLAKKTSSFFRRRKRSFSEARPPPMPAVMPLQLSSSRGDLDGRDNPSPVSSLRKVMNPYITGQPINGQSKTDGSLAREGSGLRYDDSEVEESHGFSSTYVPDKYATVRAVKPSSRGDNDSRDITLPLHNTTVERDRSSPREQAVLEGRAQSNREVSFLQDSSDTDGPQSFEAEDPKPKMSQPTSTHRQESPSFVYHSDARAVARDAAFVTQRERQSSDRSPVPSNAAVQAPSSPRKSSTPARPSARERSLASYTKEWVVVTPAKLATEKDTRVWLEPTSSEEDLAPPASIHLPLEGTRVTPRSSGSVATTVYQSATSLPQLQVDGHDESDMLATSAAFDAAKSLEVPRLLTALEAINMFDKPDELADEDRASRDDIERAKRIYEDKEPLLKKFKAAAWLGEDAPGRKKTLLAYMRFYNFEGISILAAMRIVCGKLALKAETQQVDRILDAFAQRWCACNPRHGLKSTDVVHTICYSILLLNTDLHLADIESKMTRSQFVKNTMPTILHVIVESTPNAFERPSILPSKSGASEELNSGPKTSGIFAPNDSHTAVEDDRPSWRTSFMPSARGNSEGSGAPLMHSEGNSDVCGPLVKTPFHGTLRAWEGLVEIMLKDFYNSIKSERLPLFEGPPPSQRPQLPTQSTLTVNAASLRRTPSVLSKAPSESSSAFHGRGADTVRLGTGKWTRSRSRARVYPNSMMGSSRTSLDDQASIWSPSASSSTWSKYSLGKPQVSMSVDSFSSNFPNGDYQQSIGFANALSQAIIREETVATSEDSAADELKVAPLLDDESLELAGAPWAKEGMVKHKHHLEAQGKRARDRNWSEIFAVIEKGYMSLFSFTTKSIRKKSMGKNAGGVVGGGNWQDNAENLGSFLLRQTIASALPAPGYSKMRPHVWALSLPTGAVHLFQVGTAEIVREFVSTANYWSARLSHHPLVGGISNIEYGWSDAVVNTALVSATNENNTTHSRRASSNGPRPSMTSSLRGSLDHGSSGARRLPGDRITISDWTPPTQNMRSSSLLEPDQLKALVAYVRGIEDELQRHNQLRSPMLLAFTPRQANSTKAMANWEKKSSYLLREIVKFRTYIDTLHAAQVQRRTVYDEREKEKGEWGVSGGTATVGVKDDAEEGDSTLRA